MNKINENQFSSKNNYSLTSYGILCYKKIDDEYKIVLVRRKNTSGYVEFLRGKYDTNDCNYIISLFDYMTIQEKKNITEIMNFDKLRNLLGMAKKNNIYKLEYEKANKKFNILKIIWENNLVNLINNRLPIGMKQMGYTKR